MWTPERIAIGKELNLAIERGNETTVRALCTNNPWIIIDHKWDGERIWLEPAAQRGNVPMLRLLLELGFGVNALRLPEKSSALSYAINGDHLDAAQFLLSSGANPNHGRAIIGALRRRDPTLRRQLVELLVEHGVDLNQLFDVYGDKDNVFTALDWAKDDAEMAAYLQSHGAKTADELKRAPKQAPAKVGVRLGPSTN